MERTRATCEVLVVTTSHLKRSPVSNSKAIGLDPKQKEPKRQETFVCDICNRDFLLRSNLEKHYLSHTCDEPFGCETCDGKFGDDPPRKEHCRMHNNKTSQKRHECKSCGRRFVTKAHLAYHLRTHTGEKPFACEVCGKRFSLKSTLLTHCLTHTKEKSHVCDICNKCFSSKSKLCLHYTNHTGEKPYTCQTCNKGFTQKYNLLKHSLQHTGDKPFACETCDKAYFCKYDLKRHKKIHKTPLVHEDTHSGKNVLHASYILLITD